MKDLTKAQKKEKIARIMEMQETTGWKMLVEDVSEKIDLMTHALCVGVEGESLEDVRVQRAQRSAYKMLVGYPEKMIKSLQPMEKSQELSDESLDPYHKKK